MKTSTVILSLLFISITGFCQGPKVFMDESFANNFRDWSVKKAKNHFRAIQDGKMYLGSDNKSYHWSGQGLPTVDKKKSFQMTTEVAFTEFTESGYAGVLWGGSDNYEKMCFFVVSADGTFQYGKYDPDFESLSGVTAHEAIKKGVGAANKLTITKDKGTLTLHINDVEVYSAKAPSSFGNIVGVVCGGGTFTASLDYLKITEVPK